MKVLRLTLLVLFAASLTTLLTSPVQATDHPWDDSTVDSTTTTGVHDSGDDEPTIPEDESVAIVLKAKIMIIKFLNDFFTLDVTTSEDVAVGNDNAEHRVESRFNWRTYRADIK
ncbi:MAG: hypothetical protein ABIJ61_04860 [bacterium]